VGGQGVWQWLDSQEGGLSMKTITSMKRARFDELLAGAFDGTLMDKWGGIDEDNMTKAQEVEARQLRAIRVLHDSGKLAEVCDMEWRELVLFEKDGRLQVELKRG
jgi:hypothetical protein